jgi:hypothetical protein
MKRLAGTPNPPSWKETKLSTYPAGGVGAAPLGGTIHSGCGSPERGRSKPSATRASRSSTVTVEKGQGSRGGTTVTRSAIAKRRGVAAERKRCMVFFLWLFPWFAETKAGGDQQSKEPPPAPLSDIYKGPGKTRSTLRPNPLQNSDSKTKRPFLERLAQWLPREPLVPSH